MGEVTVKMKMSEVRMAYIKINEVINEKKLFPGKVNIAIAKNNMALDNQMKCFNEGTKPLVERFALKDENGNPEIKNNSYVFETKEMEKQYVKGVEELDKTEVDIQIIKVEYDAFDGGKDDPTAFDLVALEFMLA